MNYSRRQFQLMTITAAISTAMTSVSSATRKIKQSRRLKRRNVLIGLMRGIEYKGPVKEILVQVQTYSSEQTLVGGCVFCLASREPADIVHILVKTDPLDAAKGLGDLKVEGMESVNGNSIVFTYREQQFFIEHLSETLYEQRLKNLEPGSKDNGFYIEFAHQLVTYNVQTKRNRDPKRAIGRSSSIKLRRVKDPENAASVLKTMVESKRLGLELPKTELRRIENTLQQGLGEGDDPLSATATFLSQLSHFCHFHEERHVRNLMSSKLAADTLERVLGCSIKKLQRTFYKIKRIAPRDTPHCEIWLCAIRCLEDTDEVNCHETLQYLKREHSGLHLLCCKEVGSNSSKLLQIDSVKRLHIKRKRRGRN